MTPDEEEFLTQVHQLLDKRAVPPTSPQYVAIEELPGNVLGLDAVRLLGHSIRTTADEPLFVTGQRGSGKTVQFLRLKQDLQADGFAVRMFSAAEYMKMGEPVNIVDMLFFLVGAISDQAIEDGLIINGDADDSPGWTRLRAWLKGLPGIELTPNAKLSFPALLDTTVSLKAAL